MTDPGPNRCEESGVQSPDPSLWMTQFYDAVHDLAAKALRREPSDHTLQATALVHEAYLRLAGQESFPSEAWTRSSFLAAAANVVRRVLVDHARRAGRVRRGRGWQRITLSGVPLSTDETTLSVLDLEEAMQELERHDLRKARLVELRFYAGLTLDEAARELRISRRTAANDWSFSRAWLARRLDEGFAREVETP